MTKCIKYTLLILIGAAAAILLLKKPEALKKGCCELKDQAKDLSGKVSQKLGEAKEGFDDFTDGMKKTR